WARGDDIVSVLSPDYDFSLQGRSRENIVGQHYIRMSGASMATPFISGAVALLLEKHPRARPDDIRRMLLNMADHGLLTEEMLLT
ncbi:MAG: S8 family serine peptidase, partial [Anaerotignum sp.]|nr:S8 family serine peptidase [Anaerotignum sp.]